MAWFKSNRQKNFNIKEEEKKAKEKINKQKGVSNYLKPKENVYDELNDAIETYGQSEVEREIFD